MVKTDSNQLPHEEEGVIKFQLEHQTAELAQHPLFSEARLIELDTWRHIQFRLKMIGQDPTRYDGYGFGNISARLAKTSDNFLITGTQTGEPEFLTNQQYAIVTECHPAANRIQSMGPMKPSSEAMTHGQLYQLSSTIDCVIHVHCPEIWQCAQQLNVPTTTADVPYGTPQMAQAVEQLFSTTSVAEDKIFAMAGHLDGVVTFGQTFDEATQVLTRYLAQAIALTHR